jgi:hypothetical protein
MKLKIYSSFALLIFAVAGCSNNKRVDPEFNYERIGGLQKGDSITANEFKKVNLPGTNLPGTKQSPQIQTDILNPPHGKPGHICGAAEGASTNSSTAPVIAQPQTTTAVAPNINNKTNSSNPAHGQPGHVCGTAVGAPLKGNPSPLTTQPQPTVTPAAKPISTATDKSLNPAHGQPGHRCDINVGAPLNSKVQTGTKQNPAAAVNSNTTEAASPWAGTLANNSPAAIQQNALAKNDAKSIVAPGMNPAHGQPGHRCDIPTGTSLSQPIVKTDAIKNTSASSATKKDADKK